MKTSVIYIRVNGDDEDREKCVTYVITDENNAPIFKEYTMEELGSP